MKKQKGITLVSLILTVVVLLIIVVVSVTSGTEALDSTRLEGFYMQLEIVQKRVDDIAATNENYIDESGNTRYLKEQGKIFGELDSDKQTVLTNIIDLEGGNVLSGYIANFRYFTSEELESILSIPNIDYNVFIDFENRIIIAEQGIEIAGKKYHMLESAIYFIKNNPSKNIGDIDFDISVSKYGNSKYRLTITPKNTVGDIQNLGVVKYKKLSSNYWENSNSLKIIVDELTEYDVIYQDKNNNKSTQRTFRIALNEEGEPYISETIKIFTVAQLLELDNQMDKKVSVILMNNLEFDATNLGIDYYWTPIGERENLKDSFDGKDYSINVTYTDSEGERYTITYNDSNNFSEEEVVLNITPKLEDGTEAKEAYISVNNVKTNKQGKQEIKIKRLSNVIIKAEMDDKIAYIPTEIEFKIVNPNKNELELTIYYRYIKFNINPTPSDADVIINGQKNPGTIEIIAGQTVNWSVESPTYESQSGEYTTSDLANQTLEVKLEKNMVTITVNPTPSDAIVKINGETRKTITVQAGTTINWSVSKTYYEDESGTYTADSNKTQTIPVTLSPTMVTITVNPTPSDATVKINGETRKTITVQAGTTINWSATKTYYEDESGTYTANGNKTQTIPVTLSPTMVTITINPNLSDATVTINGENRKSITVQAGTNISWSVTKNKYYTQEGSFIASSSETIPITLEPIPTKIVFTVNPTPSDATVTINGQATKSVEVMTGTQISWSVSKTYYQGKSGTFTAVVDDKTENVTLTENPTVTLALTPSTASGSSITSINSAIDGHTTTDYATSSITSNTRTLTWTWNTDKFSNMDANARITAFSVVSKTGGTMSPTTNLTFKVGSTSFGTASGSVGTKTITPSSRPTAAQLKASNSTLTAVINKKTLGIGYWYGATINITYQNP